MPWNQLSFLLILKLAKISPLTSRMPTIRKQWLGPALLIILTITICGLVLVHFYKKAAAELREPPQDPSKPLIVWPMNAYIPAVLSGGELACHEMNKQLIADGLNVTVVTRHWKIPGLDGVRIIPSVKDDYSATAEAKDAFKKASAICIQNVDFNIGMQLCRIFRKPAVFFIHATSHGKEYLNYSGSWPIFVVYNSWSMKADMSSNYKSYIVKPWIDTSRFLKIADKQAAKHYVTLINLNDSKGGSLLIEIAKQMPDLQFLGVEGGYGDQVKDTSASNITYMSKTDKIEGVYEKSKVVIMPSRLETWGRVAVEAMASGTPLIINDVQGMREACGDAALIARREDVGDWVHKIRRLLTDPLFYKEQVQKGLRRAQELDDKSDMNGLSTWLRSEVFPAQPSALI